MVEPNHQENADRGDTNAAQPLYSSNPELENFGLYRLAEEMSDLVWKAVVQWDEFAKKSIGNQLVDAADSVGANISEAYGRFHFRDRLSFLFYARGSLSETDTRLRKASRRGLLDDQAFRRMLMNLSELMPRLNGYIQKIRREAHGSRSRPGMGKETPEVSDLSIIYETAADSEWFAE